MHVLGDLGMGGAEMGVVRMIMAMNNETMRHSIVIFGSNRSLLDEVGVDIPCHSLGINGRSYTAFLGLAKLFKTEQVDLIHVNNLAPWFDTALGAKLAGCPCVETFHGVEEGCISFPLVKRVLFRLAALMSIKITAVAEEASDLLVSLTGISHASVEVIYNGINTMRFAPLSPLAVRTELRRAKGLPEEKLLFGCVAALRPVKNHSGLLRAFSSAVKATGISAALVLLGDGPLAKELEALAGDLEITDKVHFLGRRTDIPELLQCFDAFVLNSDTEGLSYAVLEAMACGLPLIGTAVGGNIRLVEEGVQGLLVPPGDENALSAALEQAMNDPEQLQNMGHRARNKVEAELGHMKMVDRYRSLYSSLTNPGSS